MKLHLHQILHTKIFKYHPISSAHLVSIRTNPRMNQTVPNT